jgi:hypothetical protein
LWALTKGSGIANHPGFLGGRAVFMLENQNLREIKVIQA